MEKRAITVNKSVSWVNGELVVSMLKMQNAVHTVDIPQQAVDRWWQTGSILSDVTGNPASVLLDYSTPTYWDCSIGAYLYFKLPTKGVHILAFAGKGTQAHVAYLTKIMLRKKKCRYS